MVTTKLNLSMTEPSARQIYAKQGDTGRVLDITLDQTPEDGTLRILRPDGTEVTSDAVTGGEVSESGETVTFDSLTEADVTELTVGIEPVQDLHGYDAPWPAGGGKNLYDASIITGQGSAGNYGVVCTVSNGVINFNGTATSNAYFSILHTGLPSGDYVFTFNNPVASSGVHVAFKNPEGQYFSDTRANAVNKSVAFTGEPDYIVLFVNSGTTLTDFVIKPQLETGSTPTSWTPYSNICPITGHDEVRVTRTGKNLYNSAGLDGYGDHGITVTQSSDGTLVFNGTATDNTFFTFANTGYENKRYTYSLNNPVANSGVHIAFRDTNRNYFGDVPANTVNKVVTFTNEPNDIFLYVLSGTTLSNFTVKPQLELGATATAYEPYRSNTYTTSLGQTVYGGTLDMVSGVLTVTHAIATISNFGTLTNYTSSGGLYYSQYSVNSVVEGVSMSSMLTQKTTNGGYSSTTECFSNEGSRLRVYTNATTDASFRTKFADLQIVYPLATPTVINLTPRQIKTLVGTNNVWASSGQIVNITFTYGGLLSELPSDATSVAGKCYCDIEQNGVSSMPFTLNVKKNERES